MKGDDALPAVDIVDEQPIGDAARALDPPVIAGDLSSGAADTVPKVGLGGDPANSGSPDKRGRGRPPGSGKPFQKTPRPRGDATFTQKEIEKLRKNEVEALFLAEQRKTKALEEKLEDARVLVSIGTVEKSSLIDDSIHEAVGFAAETAGNIAAARWGPAARINHTQKEQLATAWTRVAKLYLGEHAKYSPVAAALLATVAVVGEKYVDVQLAAAGSARPALVSSQG